MNRVEIVPLAQQDLNDIWSYIAQDNERAADRQIDRFSQTFKLLAESPLMGELREDLRPGLRVFSVGRYAVLYYTNPGAIQIIGVLHGARDIGIDVFAGRPIREMASDLSATRTQRPGPNVWALNSLSKLSGALQLLACSTTPLLSSAE